MSRLENKKILITGGAGFIGSNLCHYFLKSNEVVCLDNLSTGNFDNISELESNPNFTFLDSDIRNYESCVEAVIGVDIVLHQAALGSVSRSIENPINTNSNNITGFLNIIEATKEAGIKRFVFAASSSTYGDHKGLPKVEENIGKPLSPYAITKYANELYAKVFSDLYGLETIGLRYFNVFGPHQDPNGAYAAVIPKFIDLISKNETITVHGDGKQTRDFTYIDNVIQANELACLTENKQALNTIYNIAYGGQLSLNDLVQLINESLLKNGLSGKDLKVEYGAERAGDVRDSFASIDKAINLLEYSPEVSVEDGMMRYLEFLKQAKTKID
ncbi:SDR family oxidoreductase [Crocinitomix catalasitica]|nr:SDR family oxidoreductase [Crocinitomix catalasitica]